MLKYALLYGFEKLIEPYRDSYDRCGKMKRRVKLLKYHSKKYEHKHCITSIPPNFSTA
jgi:hypothetical protein